MGTKFANIQVHTGGRPVAEVRAAITDLFRQRMLRDGFIEITGDIDDTEDDQYALFRNDRTVHEVFLRPAESGPWIAVYDEQVEFGDEETIRDITQALSSAVHGVALAVQVVDSDVLELYLYRDGERIDDYSNDPFHPEVGYTTRRRRKDFTGRPSRWRDLLVPGATPTALRAAWDERPIFAEEILKSVAPLLGVRYEEWFGAWQDAWMAWRNLRQGAEPLFPGLVRLAFRSTLPPIVAQAVEGSPRLVAVSGVGGAAGGPYRLGLSIGDRLEHFTFTVRNEGGRLRGLGVVVYGSALDQGLIDPTAVRIADSRLSSELSLPEEPVGLRDKEYALAAGQSNGMQTRSVVLPEFEVDAAVAVTEPEPANRPVFGRRVEGPSPPRDVMVTVLGTATAPGLGDLWCRVVPLENPEEGRVDWPFALQVGDLPRRPLRSRPDVASAAVRPLAPSDHLVALVVLGADRPTSAAVAREAIERWWEVITPQDDRRCVIALQPAPHVRSQSRRLQARRLLQHRNWSEWRAMLATCARLSGMFEWPLIRFTGFTFEVDPLGSRAMEVDDAPVPYLSFFRDLHGLGSDEQDATSTALTAIVDDVMARASGVQAFVTRWHWNVGSASYSTPYESACGIHGEVSSRAWVTRYLRGVSERLWLGPDLPARLGDLWALQAIAEVTPVGARARVILKEGADLDTLERVLAPLLPSRADWDAAMGRADQGGPLLILR